MSLSFDLSINDYGTMVMAMKASHYEKLHFINVCFLAEANWDILPCTIPAFTRALLYFVE